MDATTGVSRFGDNSADEADGRSRSHSRSRKSNAGARADCLSRVQGSAPGSLFYLVPFFCLRGQTGATG
jgi:hypothetical protein